jgi:hypothetical protein
MRSKSLMTAGWFWKRRPIPGPGRPPSNWIRSNGFTASLRIFRIRAGIAKDVTAHSPTAPGFPPPPLTPKAPACRQRSTPSGTIRISPGKPAAHGLASLRRFSKRILCCARAAAACPSLDACAARIRPYAKGIIVQTIGKLEDEFDGEGMMDAAHRHAQSFRRFLKELRIEYPGMLPMGTESCSICESCSYPDAQCRDPYGANPPMEAFGMLVNEVCRANRMEYCYGKGTITFTGCFLLE